MKFFRLRLISFYYHLNSKKKIQKIYGINVSFNDRIQAVCPSFQLIYLNAYDFMRYIAKKLYKTALVII